MELWTLGQVALTGTGAFTLSHITDFTPSPGIEQVVMGADGNVDPTFIAVPGVDPRFRLTTTMLATLLAKASSAFLIQGLPFETGGAGLTGLDAYLLKHAQGGTIASGTVHKKISAVKGMLIPRAIQCAQGGNATMGLEVIPISTDGATAPVSHTDVTAPAATAVSELFTLGPVQINGSAVDGVQNVSIDPGLSVVVMGADGNPYRTFCGITARRPGVQFVTTKASCIDTFGWTGAALSATAVVYLRRYQQGSVVYGDGESQHIKMTLTEGHVAWRDIPTRHGGQALATVSITPRKGTPAIIIIATGAAIT